jgi:hypothetical protein
MKFCVISERVNQFQLIFSDWEALCRVSVIFEAYSTVTAMITVFLYVMAALSGLHVPAF